LGTALPIGTFTNGIINDIYLSHRAASGL
jgi:hypothetical protein